MAAPTPQNRDELLAKREHLRRQRGVAVLDGERFDGAPLIGINTSLEALEDAEAEAVRRARTAATQAAVERHSLGASMVADHDRARLVALRQAEQAAREMVAAMGEVQRESEAIINACRRLAPLSGMAAVPVTLTAAEVERRLGRFLAGALHRIRTDQYLAETTWPPPALPTDDWVAAEQRATDADIAESLRRLSPKF